MSQQINLFNPLFRKKGFSFASAMAMAVGTGIVVAIAALFAVYQNQQLRTLEAQAAAVDQAYKEAATLNEKLTAQLANKKPSTQAEAEFAALDAKLQARREIVDALQNGVIGNTDGFSAYMRAFSRQSVSGLWLTGFDIARAGNEFAIQGRTTSTDLVANYLKQLNQEPALQGQQFAAMRIYQPLSEPIKGAAEQKVDKDTKAPTPVLPRFLEFTISTADIPDNPGMVSKSPAVEAPLLGNLSSPITRDALRARVEQAGGR
ncbi:MAG: mannose-sensitive agglutinin [Betaproteobacteria bacterium]|nr:mannose-sensitive agglutinin [Betaproteobacteria bacterium]